MSPGERTVMSLLSPLEHLIRKLDTEAAAEVTAIKAEAEARLGKVLPVFKTLESDLQTAVTDAVEQAAPGVRAAVQAALAAAEEEVRHILGLG